MSDADTPSQNTNETPRSVLRSIDTEQGLFELLDGGVLFWTVARGIVLNEDTARAAHTAAVSIAPAGPYAVIADARGLGFADKTARGLLAGFPLEGRVATGVIVTNQVIRYLADQYRKQVEQERVFEVFDSEADAIEWGVRQVREADRP